MMTRGKGNMKKCFILVPLILAVVVAGEIWGIRSSSAAAKPKKLRMVMPEESSGTGPLGGFQATNLNAEPIVFNVMEPLVDYTKNGPVPKLATKWEQRDPTTWRFYLRRGVKFHNGADFTSRDVVEFAKWVIELKDLLLLYQYVPLKTAVAVDDYTVDLIFNTPQPLFLVSGRAFLIPPVALSRDNRELYKMKPIGTGPYRFVEWVKGQHIKLTKFEGYWGPKPQIGDVDIIFRAEEGVRLAALMAGEVDWVYGLSPEQATRAPKVARMASPETVWMRFDEYIQKEWTGVDPLFADKRLRLAVDHAIDRKALVAMYRGFATPSLGQFASPGDFGFNPNLKSRPYDPEKAKALVREAGAVGKSLTMVGSTDRWSKDREVAEAIAYMIEQTGLKVKQMLMPQAESGKYKKVFGPNRQYMDDIHLSTGDTFLEVESRFRPLFTEGGANFALNDPEPTKLYNEVLAETDYAKRREKLTKAWTYVYEQTHYLPLFKLEWIWGMAKNLEWNMDIAGRPFLADMRFTD